MNRDISPSLGAALSWSARLGTRRIICSQAGVNGRSVEGAVHLATRADKLSEHLH